MASSKCLPLPERERVGERAFAGLFLAGTSVETMRDAVLVRPHLALLPAGVALLCYGSGFVIGA